MSASRGEAPGKIILLGEHAVVYGHPALAVPVHERRAEASVELDPSGAISLESQSTGKWIVEGSGPRCSTPLVDLARATLDGLGAEGLGIRAYLRSTIPVGCGMGSSAAIAVALVRGIAGALDRRISPAETANLVMISERGFHGNPSGVDAEVIARGEPIFFTRSTGAEAVQPKRSAFCFVIANSGRGSNTASVVRDVALARERDPIRYDSFFSQMGALAASGRAILDTGSPVELGPVMTRAQALLREIGVSSAELDELVRAALCAGAMGAKLSGAGRGGNVVALLGSQADEAKVREAFWSAGGVDTCGVRLEPAHAEARA